MWIPFLKPKPSAGNGVRRQMPEEVRALSRAWAPLSGRIAGLTQALEKEFRFGQSVIALDGKYRLGGNLKGGSSAMWIPAEREAFEAYRAWRERDGMPRVKDRRAFKRLRRICSSHGVRLLNGSWSGEEQETRNFSEKRGTVYRLTRDVLSCLPATHLSRPQFEVLQLGGWGPDGAKASAYEDGKVMIYDFALNGARRTFLGLLLHELGHAQEAAFPDSVRGRLKEAYERIARAGAVMGVDFLVDAQARKLYQLRFFEEFAAETYMIYTSQGGELRAFMGRQTEKVARAWRRVYDEYKAAFGGVEYR